MRVVLAALLAALGFAGAAAAATSLGPAGGAFVTVSNAHAGAKPVALTVSIHTELQCGRLRGNSVVLQLPSQAQVPATIAASAVQVEGIAAARVAVTGSTLSIALARPKLITCDVIGPGIAKIVVSQAARIGNPRSAGTYSVVARLGAETFATHLSIKS